MRFSLNRILTITLISIASFIVLVSLVFIIARKAWPGKNLRSIDPSPDAIAKIQKKDATSLAAFTGLGSIRAVTKADEKKINDIGVPLVIEAWFSYPEGDTEFYEELAKKSSVLKGIIVNYFALYTYEQLRKMGEDKVKDELLVQLNNHLVLGKISALYFSEYLFFE